MTLTTQILELDIAALDEPSAVGGGCCFVLLDDVVRAELAGWYGVEDVAVEGRRVWLRLADRHPPAAERAWRRLRPRRCGRPSRPAPAAAAAVSAAGPAGRRHRHRADRPAGSRFTVVDDGNSHWNDSRRHDQLAPAECSTWDLHSHRDRAMVLAMLQAVARQERVGVRVAAGWIGVSAWRARRRVGWFGVHGRARSRG